MANRGFTKWDTEAALLRVVERLGMKKLHGHHRWGVYVRSAIKYVLLGEGEIAMPPAEYKTPRERNLAQTSVHVVRECLEEYLEANSNRSTQEVRARLEELPKSFNDLTWD